MQYYQVSPSPYFASKKRKENIHEAVKNNEEDIV